MYFYIIFYAIYSLIYTTPEEKAFKESAEQWNFTIVFD